MEYKVQTPCGMIRGTAGRVAGTAAYKGIRYATAGRWEYPVQVTAWDGVYDATQYGKCCYQPRAFFDESKRGKAFYYHEFREGEHYDYSEDCLFLNVFAPDAAREGDDLPVIVYIHGGSFVGGCGHEKHFNGPVWPAKGVIGVTINYRLGPLGFACLPQLKEEAGTAGNYGLYDQMTAIRWVRDNIRSFGGNPENITIMGQSAGAMSVQQLCQSPLTDGLFQKAVLSSGGGQDEKFAPESMESRFAFWQAVMKNAGCDTLDSFRALPVETLFEAWMKTGKEIPSGPPSPVCDGKLIIECKGKPRKAIPIMAGSTSEDMMPDLLHRMVIDWCAAQPVPAYAWYFDRQLPGDDEGAWHSSDLWYWFGTLENGWRPMEEKDYALSEQMTDDLCSFARFGHPSHPQWKPCTQEKQVLRMGEHPAEMEKLDMQKLTEAAEGSKATGE